MNPPQPKPPNLTTTAAPELTRIKPVNPLHLMGESFAAHLRIFGGLDLGSGRSVQCVGLKRRNGLRGRSPLAGDMKGGKRRRPQTALDLSLKSPASELLRTAT